MIPSTPPAAAASLPAGHAQPSQALHAELVDHATRAPRSDPSLLHPLNRVVIRLRPSRQTRRQIPGHSRRQPQLELSARAPASTRSTKHQVRTAASVSHAGLPAASLCRWPSRPFQALHAQPVDLATRVPHPDPSPLLPSVQAPGRLRQRFGSSRSPRARRASCSPPYGCTSAPLYDSFCWQTVGCRGTHSAAHTFSRF